MFKENSNANSPKSGIELDGSSQLLFKLPMPDDDEDVDCEHCVADDDEADIDAVPMLPPLLPTTTL